MLHTEISKPKRIMAAVFAALMLSIILFSAFFIAHEAHHDCSGEDCPICACIRQCENTLHRIGGGISARPTAVICFLLSLFVVFAPEIFFFRETPISRKVRLNN